MVVSLPSAALSIFEPTTAFLSFHRSFHFFRDCSHLIAGNTFSLYSVRMLCTLYISENNFMRIKLVASVYFLGWFFLRSIPNLEKYDVQLL